MSDKHNGKTGVVLLSGGLDSATTMALAVSQGYGVHALTFDYGQQHKAEIDHAVELAKRLNAVSHKIISIDLASFGGSALTDDNIKTPKADPGAPVMDNIPVTYVPARNTVFLSIALARAETLETSHIFIGVNALDYSGYPDCRPEYIEAFEKMANLATKAGVEGRIKFRVHTPLISMTKKQIIQTGTHLGVPFHLTLSCYAPDPDGRPCRMCDACRLRAKGFLEAGIDDPAGG